MIRIKLFSSSESSNAELLELQSRNLFQNKNKLVKVVSNQIGKNQDRVLEKIALSSSMS